MALKQKALRVCAAPMLALALCVCALVAAPLAQAADVSISSAAEWNTFAAAVNAGTTYEGDTVTLTADLDGSSLTCVGTAEHPFEGTFKGNKHIVSDLALSGTSYVGLFGVVGASGTVQDLKVTGTVTCTTSTEVVCYVGGLAGLCKGKLINCSSAVVVSVTSSLNGSTVTSSNAGIVAEEIGGLAGACYGNMTYCKFSGSLTVYLSGSNSTLLARNIGGLVGSFGGTYTGSQALYGSEQTTTGTISTASYCVNRGNVRAYSSSADYPIGAVGGVAGFAMGHFYDCTNNGEVSTWVGTYASTSRPDGNGYSRISCGKSTGGVVGCFRFYLQTQSASEQDIGMTSSRQLEMYLCTNNGEVCGLIRTGGVCGNTGSYTMVKGCENNGLVSGTRSNKPLIGGIVGQCYGSVSYCANKGGVMTETGAGYYCAGICGVTYVFSSSSYVPEVYSCYNVGYIYASSTSYRSAGIVGQNEGYLHNCIASSESVASCASSCSIVYTDVTYTSQDCQSVSETYFLAKLTAASVATRPLPVLNFAAATDGYSIYWTIDTSVDESYPVLNVRSSQTKTSLAGLSVSSVGTTTAASTLATSTTATTTSTGTIRFCPMPRLNYIYVSIDGESVQLAQGTDFYVKTPTNAYDAGTYTATLVGIGAYEGELNYSVEYTVSASITAATAFEEVTYVLSDASAYLATSYLADEEYGTGSGSGDEEETPAHTHSYVAEVTTEAKCGVAGVRTYTCSCGDSYTEEIAALEHSYSSSITKAASCTEKGVLTYTCSLCGDTYTEDIDMVAHTVVEVAAVAATCTTDGCTAGTKCSVCGEILSGCETIAAGHTSVAVEAKAATCTTDGCTAGTKCSVCGEILSGCETVAAAHTVVDVAAVAATCTAAGCTAGTKCSVCSEILSGCETVAALGHSYTGVVTKSATCTEKGVTTYTCARCNSTYTEDIALAAHTSVDVAAVAATCTTAGSTAGTKCSVCGEILSGCETVAAAHTSVDVAAVAATCTAAGCTAGTKCSVCGEILSGCEATAQLTHSYASVVTKAASCTEAGVITYTCSLCGDSYTVAEEAEGHVFADGACKVCGEADPDYIAPVTTIAQTIKASKTSVKIKAKKGKKATITIKNAKTALAIKSLSGAAKKALGVKVSGKKVTIKATAKAKKGKSYTIKVYAKAKGSYAKSNVVKIKVTFK